LDKQPPWARGFVMVLQSALSDLNRFQLHNRKTPRLSMQAADFLPENAPARRVGFVFVQLPVLSKRAKPVVITIRLQAQFITTVDA
jgi:hypothetical protein